jgi:energy-coupling factor transporter ATP-binding protein EcfA2
MSMLADYEAERQAFEALLARECAQRILLVQGVSGCGKTALLNACQRTLPREIRHVPVQFRDNATGMAEIFSRTVRSLGGLEYLPHFAQAVDTLSHLTQVRLQDIHQRGSGNRISLALRTDDPHEREKRRVRLTETWFEDVQAQQPHLLLIMDTYEKAVTEVKDWLSGPFLARVADTSAVRVVIAGQEVPDPHNIEWEHCCTYRELYGVVEAQYWLPVMQALGRRVPVEPPLVYLAGICSALRGHPGEIMKLIQDTFPRTQ